jgi:hypothetical protein
MNHPMVEEIMWTGYPASMQEVEADHPVEDMFGDEILNERYFVFKNGDVVLEINLGHYAVQELGADEIEA